MNDNECLQTSPTYEGAAGDSFILIGEVYGNGAAEVAFTIADIHGGSDIAVDPEEALKIGAAITDAAHIAITRREMGW